MFILIRNFYYYILSYFPVLLLFFLVLTDLDFSLHPKNSVTFNFIYIVIYYFMSYQKPFVYKMFNNIQETNNKPLYDINSSSYKDNQANGLKYNLAMRQGWRCMNCQNPILQKDIFNHSIHYIQPLQFGGPNDVTNLGLKCQTCTNFSPY